MAKSRKSLSAVRNFQNYLPEELLIHILLVLPIKALVRFRCVCKLLYEIISSNSFKNTHIKTSAIATNYILFEDFTFYTLRRQQSSIYKSRKLRNHQYRPDLLDVEYKSNFGVKVYGSCNGLLCLADSTVFSTFGNVWLWNPMIRKIKRIPNVPLNDDKYVDRLCFGYFDDDYKVIKLGLSDKFHCAAVYSLRTDDWKITYCSHHSDGIYTPFDLYNPCPRFVNGTAYFAFYSGIVCFNLRDERIGKINYPENFSRHIGYTSHFSPMEEYKDSIALMQEVGSYSLLMWVLRKSDNITRPLSSWEKILTIDLQSVGFCLPLGFMNSDEYMVKTRNYDLYSYNLETSQLKKLTFGLNFKCLLHVNPFVESLALLDERSIGSFAEPERCSTHPIVTLHKKNKEQRLIVQAKRKYEDNTTEKE